MLDFQSEGIEVELRQKSLKLTLFIQFSSFTMSNDLLTGLVLIDQMGDDSSLDLTMEQWELLNPATDSNPEAFVELSPENIAKWQKAANFVSFCFEYGVSGFIL